MGYYGTSSQPRATYKPTPLPAGGGLDIDSGPAPSSEVGKGSLDLTDIGGSAADTLANFAGFLGNATGGVAGALGALGPDGETASLGQLAEDIGRIPGGIGDIKRPWDADDPTAPTLGQAAGQALGAVGDVISAPGRFARERIAESRVIATKEGRGTYKLPADLQDRLDAGESVDVIADELLARGQEISRDPVAQFVGEVVLDPLNLIAPGASKAFQGARAAGMAVRGGKELAAIGLGERAIGTIYNVSANGLDRAGGAFMDKVIGPVTSGVFHTLGTKSYKSLVSQAGKLDRSYGLEFERNFALGAGQLPRAVIAREIANDVATGLTKKAKDVEGVVQERLFAKKGYARDELERRTEELLGRVTPSLSVIDDAVIEATHRKYAAASGMSVEDAARVLGRVDRDTARTVHLAYYGKAGGELAELKKVIPSSEKLDVERLTVIAPDTLTAERADAILKGDISGAEAVEGFSVLGNHFGAKNVADSDVLAFVQKLLDEGALPEAVRLPKTGKNALPKELGEWRAKNKDFGYDLGFAPKDGWKSIVDENGNVIMSDPFVHFVSDVDPVTMRNPLGRFMDGLTRGINQTVIVQESRDRMVDLFARAKLSVPISDNQVRAIHRAVWTAAADAKETPRSLITLNARGPSGKSEVVYNSIFRKFLNDDQYQALIEKFDPTYAVMHAAEGNWRTVGLTQKFTGRAKRTFPIVAKITEGLYPKARFRFRPTFQGQEMVETEAFNTLRGVADREISDELRVAYRAFAEQPEFKWMTDAGFLNVAGERMVVQYMGKNTAIGRAMGRFVNIAERKDLGRVRQTMFEHGEEFKKAVQQINPRYWRAYEEAYGTTDARVIADRFIAERMALGASENIDEAMALIDEATAGLKGTLDDATIRPGAEAASQAANVEVGVLNGGSRGSGGAVLDEGVLPGRAGEMVLQAFKDSFRRRSNIAFQTHFFNPQRGWLERTLNHPYLGLYPLSYMWGKVLPEFARFLVVRPFGKDVPLVAAANLERVQQAYLGALADDPEFSEWIAEHEESIYFANLMWPGNPVNLTVNFPAWARHLGDVAASNAQGGNKKLDITTFGREATNAGDYSLNPARDIEQSAEVIADLGDIATDIFANIDKAAAQYDGQFPLRSQPVGPTLAP